MLLTVIQASRATGKSRQTLYRLVDSGKLSASTDNNGRLVFETSELMRQFGQLRPHDKPDSVEPNETTGQAAPSNQLAIENAQLRAQVEANQAQLKMLAAAIEKAEQREASMNERMDKLMNVVESLTLRLEHNGKHAPAASQETPEQAKAPDPIPTPASLVKGIMGRFFK